MAWWGSEGRATARSVSNSVAHQDPHQWLTLEITYDSMFAAGRFAQSRIRRIRAFTNVVPEDGIAWTMQGLTKEKMNGLDCGIYVGCATLGGIAPDIPAFGPFTNIGATLRMGSHDKRRT